MEMTMTRMMIITLEGQEQEDGSYYIRSPDVPLFHIVGKNEAEALAIAVPILKETLEQRAKRAVELTIPEDSKTILGGGAFVKPPAVPASLPAHIIASVMEDATERA